MQRKKMYAVEKRTLNSFLSKLQTTINVKYFFKLVFAAYLWGSIQNLYSEMQRKASEKPKPLTLEQLFTQKPEFGRYRTRSLIDESTMYKTACLNDFEFQDVPRIIYQMLRKEQDDWSDDSLIAPKMMLSSISNLGSYDHLKTSQSLGELGFIDLKSCDVVGLDDDDRLSPINKALRFLKLTWTDVKKAKRRRTNVHPEVYAVDEKGWNQMSQSSTQIKKHNLDNKQVYIKEMAEPDDPSNEIKNQASEKRIVVTRFVIPQEKRQESQEVLDEEKGEDNHVPMEDDKSTDITSIFMSNLKQRKRYTKNSTDRPRKNQKTGAYEKLLRQDFMNIIGPEVFETGYKLPDLTLLDKLSQSIQFKSFASNKTDRKSARARHKYERKQKIRRKHQKSKPKGKQIQDSDFESEYEDQPLLESDLTNEEDKQSLVSRSSIRLGNSSGLQVTLNRIRPLSIPACFNFFYSILKKLWPTEKLKEPRREPGKIFRKRRVVIRIIGKEPEINISHELDLVKKSEDSFMNKLTFPSAFSENETENSLARNSKSATSCPKDRKGEPENPKTYFFTDIPDALRIYCELKKMKSRPSNFLKKKSSGFRFLLRESYSLKNYKKLLSFSHTLGERNWKSTAMAAAAVSVLFGKENEETVSICSSKRKVGVECKLKNQHLDLLKKRIKYLLENKLSVGGSETCSLMQLDSHESMVSCRESKFSLDNISKTFYSTTATNSTFSETEQEGKVIKTLSFQGSSKYSSLHGIPKTDGSIEENIVWSEASSNEMVFSTTELSKEDEKKALPPIQGPSKQINPQDSDESFSLYYSKAADLASPLLDMKRFIYPDHIHYSYKHVKKKGFDVHLNGGLPLLVRESLNSHPNNEMQNVRNNPDPKSKITRRPMDLSFATTNQFAEWQNNEKSDTAMKNTVEVVEEQKNEEIRQIKPKKNKGRKTEKRGSRFLQKEDISQNTVDKKAQHLFMKGMRQLYSVRDHVLMEKLLKIYRKKFLREDKPSPGTKEKKPARISSTQLHSNKGRVAPLYNPALFLQEYKTRFEKKKMESHVERTKDMFARLEGEILMQNRNFLKSKRK